MPKVISKTNFMDEKIFIGETHDLSEDEITKLGEQNFYRVKPEEKPKAKKPDAPAKTAEEIQKETQAELERISKLKEPAKVVEDDKIMKTSDIKKKGK